MAEPQKKKDAISVFVAEKEKAELPQELSSALESPQWNVVEKEKFFGRRLREEDRVIAHGSLEFIKKVILKAEKEGFALGILPTSPQRKMAQMFGLPERITEALEFLSKAEPRPLDLLYAEEEPVFYNALVGETPPFALHNALINADLDTDKTQLFLEALKKLRSLRRVRAEIETAKGQQIRTALTGALVFNRESGTFVSGLLRDSAYNDGQLRGILISPLSIVSYIHHLLVTIFMRFRHAPLPDSVGLVKSQTLEIRCEPPLPLFVDGEKRGTTPVKFRIRPKALRFCAAESFWERNLPTQNDKETLRIEHLPQSDEAVDYAQRRLPVLTHASEQEYRDLFAALRREGKLGGTFMVLMILSTLLATVGLFLNSASVVIGAMLLAPLMQPIVVFSMGLLRWDASLAYGALRTVGIGMGLVLFSAVSVAWIFPFREITSEMAGRLHPSLLDLMVAVISGMAAAYAKNNSKISGSLAGVAIAVALVPPLSTAGIGLGWGEFGMFWHAFLLFLTNFAGIVLAAALVFMLMGFSPLHRAGKGLGFGLLIVMLVAIPLTLSFRQMVRDARILQRIENRNFRLGETEVSVSRVSLRHGREDRLILDLVSPTLLNENELGKLREKIDRLLRKHLRVEILQHIRI